MTSLPPPPIRDAFRECKTNEEKAQTALRLLLEHTGTNEGYLYELGPNGPRQIAPLDTPSPDGLISQIAKFARELVEEDGEVTVTLTADQQDTIHNQLRTLISDDGYTFQPVVLNTFKDGEFFLIGIAALRIQVGTPINPAWNLITALGDYLQTNSEDENQRP